MMDPKTNTSLERSRALVLGGGGSVGHAWLIGVIAGLFDAGLDLRQADFIIGTSAGATVAAQISSEIQPSELYADILAEDYQSRTTPADSKRVRNSSRPATRNLLEITNGIIHISKDIGDMRKKMGAWALGTDATSENFTKRLRATVDPRLLGRLWPQRELSITAVDAHTGEPVVFNRHSGADLVDAVAASVANGFAYGIGDSHYIDGGYRSNADNADLAAGYARVLVLSPFGSRSRTPVEWGTHLKTQIHELTANGSRVETIFPDKTALDAFGNNMMDVSKRPHSAQAGYSQGRALTEQLIEFWC